jgi:nucleotide-binding universal stress UspA family protein
MSEFLARATLGAATKLEHQLLSGEPVTVILQEATKHGYDLMVVGTRGRTGVTRLLLGSVTEKLIRLSPIPVLTVPTAH